jgi:hypothetical protein
VRVEPGPIPMSEPLIELLRLRRALSDLLPKEASELAPEARDVDLSFIEEIEKECDVAFPYDVMALAALRVPVFRRAVGLSLPRLGSPVRDCAGTFAAPRGWVAVASFGEKAMRADIPLDHAGFDTLLCISKGERQRHGDPEVRVTTGQQTTRPQSLSAFVRDRLAQRYTLTGAWMDALRLSQADELPIEETCIARIVDARPPAPQAPQRVRHAKFGEGLVVRVVEGDKLEIRFEGGSTKTLLRSFVRFL